MPSSWWLNADVFWTQAPVGKTETDWCRSYIEAMDQVALVPLSLHNTLWIRNSYENAIKLHSGVYFGNYFEFIQLGISLHNTRGIAHQKLIIQMNTLIPKIWGGSLRKGERKDEPFLLFLNDNRNKTDLMPMFCTFLGSSSSFFYHDLTVRFKIYYSSHVSAIWISITVMQNKLYICW